MAHDYEEHMPIEPEFISCDLLSNPLKSTKNNDYNSNGIEEEAGPSGSNRSFGQKRSLSESAGDD